MKFMYSYAFLPKNEKLLNDINSAADRLFNKLKDLDLKATNISDYNKVYFGGKLTNLISDLQKYSYILSWSLFESETTSKDFVFLDYGGGSGMLSLLAKELGLTVIYNDIYDVSCKDAETIGKLIGNQADYYIEGDFDTIIDFLEKNSMQCNAIASYDVIEHIYDIDEFFHKIKRLSNKHLTIFLSSGANICNPLIKKSLMKMQLEIEIRNREIKYGHKERDCAKAYLYVRKDIIQAYLQKINEKLSEKEIDQLARTTRGKIESDIKRCLHDYLNTRQLPEEPNHPTNTCDPYTGNWAEHLMNQQHLKNILSSADFRVNILSGYYGHSKNPIKNFGFKCLNLCITTFRKQGIRIAPFYTVYGKQNGH